MSERWLSVQVWFMWRWWAFLSRYFRWFYDWHIDYGHPEHRQSSDDSWAWMPRHRWVCDLGDRLTMGWLHD